MRKGANSPAQQTTGIDFFFAGEQKQRRMTFGVGLETHPLAQVEELGTGKDLFHLQTGTAPSDLFPVHTERDWSDGPASDGTM